MNSDPVVRVRELVTPSLHKWTPKDLDEIWGLLPVLCDIIDQRDSQLVSWDLFIEAQRSHVARLEELNARLTAALRSLVGADAYEYANPRSVTAPDEHMDAWEAAFVLLAELSVTPETQ